MLCGAGLLIHNQRRDYERIHYWKIGLRNGCTFFPALPFASSRDAEPNTRIKKHFRNFQCGTFMDIGADSPLADESGFQNLKGRSSDLTFCLPTTFDYETRAVLDSRRL
jgi:hypothetical protein